MALIGSLAINMKVSTVQLVKGLTDASRLIRAFRKSAMGDLKAGSALVRTGLGDVARGLGGIGAIAATGLGVAARSAAGLASSLGARLAPAFALVRSVGAASVDALAFTFGGLGRIVGGAILKGAAPIVAAAKATAASVDYVYGPAFRLIGRTISAAFARVPNLRPLAGQFGTVAMGAGRAATGMLMMARGLVKLGVAGAIGGIQSLAAGIGGVTRVTRQAVNQLGMFAAIAGGIAA
jgi:hypothetical protein